MEVADAIAITKADGDNTLKAKKAALEYKNAIHLFPPMQNGWIPQVNTCSAIENIGISQILENIEKFDRHMISNGWKQKKREEQNKFWLHYLIKDELGKKIYNSLLQNNKLKDLENELAKRKSIYQIIKLI
jgi:LAO/AO transport system kinase